MHPEEMYYHSSRSFHLSLAVLVRPSGHGCDLTQTNVEVNYTAVGNSCEHSRARPSHPSFGTATGKSCTWRLAP